MRIPGFLLLIVLISASCAGSREIPEQAAHYGPAEVNPETAGLNLSHLDHIDRLVEMSIKAGEIPGAVVLVARNGALAYHKAFGYRALAPEPEPMSIDTIFDIASLTKVVATVPAVMQMVDRGAVRLDERVQRYLPEFSGGGKDTVTLRQLLTHYSGLPAVFDLSREWFGYEEALKELWKIGTAAEPGKSFIYSDLNFIALGEVVRVVSGKTLDEYARENLYMPLGMNATGFLPPADMTGLIAPTESRNKTLRYLKGRDLSAGFDRILRGEVHDPTAWRMGGVSGHAGVFSSAADLAIYAQLLLNQGIHAGERLLSAASVRAMINPQSPAGSTQVRGYGWDIDSGYSSPRGDLLPGGYGHTGFTGVSLWIYPPAETVIIILTNRVHTGRGVNINHLRSTIANVVAAAISDFR
ncbi:MAG TPA: serine hydrolase domain-containing protein [Acidobacteriota bacterium]|nr:serine hydrolase domain-containing protein [Acidobacteriota bacterium]